MGGVVGSGVRWLRCVLGCWVVGSGDGLGVGVLGCRCVGSGVGLGEWLLRVLGGFAVGNFKSRHKKFKKQTKIQKRFKIISNVSKSDAKN